MVFERHLADWRRTGTPREPPTALSEVALLARHCKAERLRWFSRHRRKHMVRKTRFMVVQEAFDVLLLHLGCLPPSEGTDLLRVRIDECILRFARWRASPPTDRERDELMKRVLGLHVEVTKLERDVA
jgi:hypothetical protein